SLRSCARRDPPHGGRAGAIAGKNSARAPREIPRKRRSQQTSVRDLLNAQTCSLRCELVSSAPFVQAIFCQRYRNKTKRGRSGWLAPLQWSPVFPLASALL